MAREPGGYGRSMAERTRIDRWLWATRRFKTRSAAATACSGGKVKINGESAKPASRVTIGDSVAVRRRHHTETVEVTAIIEKRVGADKAAGCFEDRTPPEEIEAAQRERSARVVMPVYAQREAGSGRPTKRDRRKLDKLKGS